MISGICIKIIWVEGVVSEDIDEISLVSATSGGHLGSLNDYFCRC